MWRRNRDKVKEIYDSSLVSAHSLKSLDTTRAGARGLDLATDVTYSPEMIKDEDEAVIDHRLQAKLTTGLLSAPTSGLTPIMTRFKKYFVALLFLTRSELLPLRVI